MNSVHLVECEVHDVLVKCQNFLDSFVISESYFRTEVVPSFYRIVHLCMDAILICPQLAFPSFPSTDAEIRAASTEFRSLSSNGVIDGCVGCIDGLLMKIQTPSKSKTGNVKSFFSGHYQTYGINIQAACDAKCRFISICVAAPGGTSDIAAFRKCPLFSKFKVFQSDII